MVYYGSSRIYGNNSASGGNIGNDSTWGTGYRHSRDDSLGRIRATTLTSGVPNVNSVGTSYKAGERIYLEVPETNFYFYVPLEDSEMASAEIKFGATAINSMYKAVIESSYEEPENIREITYQGRKNAHHHCAGKETWIDLVGRIGQLTMNDVGDFRYSQFFKKALTPKEWLVDQIIYKTDPASQNFLLTDPVDVRGVHIANLVQPETGAGADTWVGGKPERGVNGMRLCLPLRPNLHMEVNQDTLGEPTPKALSNLAIRVGYDAYMDITTIGNYYGYATEDRSLTDGSDGSVNYVSITPHYYRLDLVTGGLTPVDVYMLQGTTYEAINLNGLKSGTKDLGALDDVVLNWTEEYTRRNYLTGRENAATSAMGLSTPSGSYWYYGTYNLLKLMTRNRTDIGNKFTYGSAPSMSTIDQDPQNRFDINRFYLQGARWHFNLGLPSSAMFLESTYRNDASKHILKYFQDCVHVDKYGEQITGTGTDKDHPVVILCMLEIYSYGDVWTLYYSGNNLNQPFKVTPDGKTYDPRPSASTGGGTIKIPGIPTYPNHSGDQMPIVEVISPVHSSKEDLTTAGTH